MPVIQLSMPVIQLSMPVIQISMPVIQIFKMTMSTPQMVAMLASLHGHLPVGSLGTIGYHKPKTPLNQPRTINCNYLIQVEMVAFLRTFTVT